MILIGTDGIWDCFTPKQLVKLVQSEMKINNSQTFDTVDLTNSMIKIQKITTKTPDLIDKLTSMYYGDNCTLMCIINKNLI